MFFNIITPCYNASTYISQYCDSLISQSFVDWQAIVVDDDSTDDSFQKLLSYTNYDDRFLILRSNSSSYNLRLKGPFFPRNIALDYINAPYTLFLDIDDYWLPDMLLNYHNTITMSNTKKFFYSSYYKCNSSLSYGYLKPRFDILPFKYQFYFYNPVPMLTACVHTSILRAHRFLDIPHEDYVFWFKLCSTLRSTEICKVPTASALYRSSSTSFSGNKLSILSWWINCHSCMGFNLLQSLLSLIVKSVFESLEYIFFRLIPIRRVYFKISDPF